MPSMSSVTAACVVVVAAAAFVFGAWAYLTG